MIFSNKEKKTYETTYLLGLYEKQTTQKTHTEKKNNFVSH